MGQKENLLEPESFTLHQNMELWRAVALMYSYICCLECDCGQYVGFGKKYLSAFEEACFDKNVDEIGCLPELVEYLEDVMWLFYKHSKKMWHWYETTEKLVFDIQCAICRKEEAIYPKITKK